MWETGPAKCLSCGLPCSSHGCHMRVVGKDQSWNSRRKHSVSVSAGIELIFFLVAGTVLGFGFSVRTMLITR